MLLSDVTESWLYNFDQFLPRQNVEVGIGNYFCQCVHQLEISEQSIVGKAVILHQTAKSSENGQYARKG